MFIIVFKLASGEELMTLNRPKTPTEERLFRDALSFRIGTTINLNLDARPMGLQVVSIDRRVVGPTASGANEPIMKFEFTVKRLE